MTSDNLGKIIACLALFTNEPLTRKDICNITEVARTSAHDALQKLHILDLIEITKVSHGRGRPTTYYRMLNND